MAYDEDFQTALPRSRKMDGTDLHIVNVSAGGNVTISDGARTAVYRPLKGEPLGPEKLRIFPAARLSMFRSVSRNDQPPV